MSSANSTFGTNSPPLGATGSEQPMGVSAVGGGKPAQAVPDKQQRQEYFQDARGGDPASNANANDNEGGHEQKREKTKAD